HRVARFRSVPADTSRRMCSYRSTGAGGRGGGGIVKATLILCDAAQVDPAGKVHILGAGWTVVMVAHGVPLPPHSVVAIVHVPWHETLVPDSLRLRLEDADGRAGMVGPEPSQLTPLVPDQLIGVRRPVGAREGISLGRPGVV